MLGMSEGRVVEERAHGGEADVACAGAVAALGLELLEERGDQRRVEVFELKPRRRLARLLLREGEQQPEGVAVAGDGVRADPALAQQPVSEEWCPRSSTATRLIVSAKSAMRTSR